VGAGLGRSGGRRLRKHLPHHRDVRGPVLPHDQAGGLLGRITRVGEGIVSVEVANNVEIQVQRAAVQTVLPKGTIK
jgi:hypothetical protein